MMWIGGVLMILIAWALLIYFTVYWNLRSKTHNSLGDVNQIGDLFFLEPLHPQWMSLHRRQELKARKPLLFTKIVVFRYI